MFGAQVEAGRQMMHMGPEEMSLWADEGSISRSRRAASSQSCPGASCSWGSGRYDSSKRVGSKRGPYKKSSHGSAFSVSSAARRDSLPWTREHPEVRSAVRSRKHEAEEQRWFEGLEEVMEQQRGTGQLRASNWLDALKDAVEAQVSPRPRNLSRKLSMVAALHVLCTACARSHTHTHRNSPWVLLCPSSAQVPHTTRKHDCGRALETFVCRAWKGGCRLRSPV